MTEPRRYTFLSYLRCLAQLTLSPVHGWEDIALEEQDSRRVLTRGLFPLAGLYALTAPLQALYHSGYSVTAVVQGALVDFVSIFVGYYLALLVLTTVAPGLCEHPADDLEADESDNSLRLLTAYGLGLLALSGIVINCMPGRFAVLGFLPLYVAVVLWRGADFIRVRPGQVERYVVAVILAVIAPWGLIQLCF